MKKAWVFRIVGILMAIIAVRGAVFVFTDKEFDYAGIPMPFVYIILFGFILATIYLLWLGFGKSKNKTK